MALTIGRRSRAVVLSAVGAGAIAFGLLAPTAGGAPAVVSSLVASPTSVTADLHGANSHPDVQSVTVKLDGGCPAALDGGLSYGVSLKTGYDATVVQVTGGDGSFNCDSVTPPTFTFTGLKCGTTTVGFHAVVGNNGNGNPSGQQKKLGDTSVDVTVLDASNTTDPNCSGTSTTVPTGSGNPAAPGIANTYIGASNTQYAKDCKKNYGNASNWRGQVISAVAAWMPRPESLKDTDFDPTATDDTNWTNYVTHEVDYLCGKSTTQPSPAPTDLPGAHA